MKKNYILRTVLILFLSLFILPIVNTDNHKINNVYASSFLKENDEKQLASEVLYYGMKKVSDNNEGFSAVVNSLNNELHAKKLVIVKTKYNDNEYVNDPTHHLSQHGNFVYSIYTCTNSSIPTYSIKNNIVYIYNIGDGAGPNVKEIHNPIAKISINDLKKSTDPSWISSIKNKLTMLNSRNMTSQDVMNKVNKITNGGN